MGILVIIVGVLLIAGGIYLRPGRTINGKTLCQGKIASIDEENGNITVKYTCKKEEFFHTFTLASFPLPPRMISKGVKVPLWTEKGNPENIITVIGNGTDMGAISRISIGLGAFFTLCGIGYFSLQ